MRHVVALMFLLLLVQPVGVAAQNTVEPADEYTYLPLANRPLFSSDSLAYWVARAVNDVRLESDLDSLVSNAQLQDVARSHSRDMDENRFFEHMNRAGEMPKDRAIKANFSCHRYNNGTSSREIGENLYTGYLYSSIRRQLSNGKLTIDYAWKDLHQLAEEVVAGWMNSPPHRANLLSPRYVIQGIGVEITSGMEIYVTQNLC